MNLEVIFSKSVSLSMFAKKGNLFIRQTIDLAQLIVPINPNLDSWRRI